MSEQIILVLLSGFLGAFIGSVIAIGFTLWRDNHQEKKRIIREKLEKVYAPLVALKKKIDLVNQSEGGFLLPSNPMEVEMVEKIIFQYYYLIDDDLKEEIVLLHSQLRNNIGNQMKIVNLPEKVIKYYNKYKKILGIK